MAEQHRTKTTLVLLVVIAGTLYLLWNIATIRLDSQPSILPGPVWILRFETARKYVGLNPIAYKMAAVLVTATLIAGIFAVVYCRKLACLGLSLGCLILWLVSGMVMQDVIAFVLPLEPVEDQPDLPRVLLIGDSISIGYTLQVRHLLAGHANVHRVNTNCASTEKGLRLIDGWLDGGDWDVIHFNWGLHDLRKVKKNGTTILDSQVSLAAYEQNLNVLVIRLKQTGAKLIWATTTPILESCDGCEPEIVLRYNRAAARVMAQHNIPVNDLFEFASSQLPEIQPRNDIHFTFEGYCLLAEQVADAINGVLSEGTVDHK